MDVNLVFFVSESTDSFYCSKNCQSEKVNTAGLKLQCNANAGNATKASGAKMTTRTQCKTAGSPLLHKALSSWIELTEASALELGADERRQSYYDESMRLHLIFCRDATAFDFLPRCDCRAVAGQNKRERAVLELVEWVFNAASKQETEEI